MAGPALMRAWLKGVSALSGSELSTVRAALRHLAVVQYSALPQVGHSWVGPAHTNAPEPSTLQLPWRLDAARSSSSTTHARLQAARERASKQLGSRPNLATPPPPAAAEQQQQQQHDVSGETQHPETSLQPSGTSAVAPEPAAGPLQVEDVVGHPALIVTKSIEWGTVIFGFEQATKYTVYDQDGNVVALMAEQVTGLGNEVARQLLRTRRSFTSTVLSPDGAQVIFRVRRPAYLINSWMYVENEEGEVIGEVRQRWHPWRRLYDLYLGRRQFATIEGGFLAWDFELKDSTGGTLALIDRNFVGFGKELFTDAGQYCIHFGYSSREAAALQQKTLEGRTGQQGIEVPEVTASSSSSKDLAVIPTYTGNQLVVARPLSLDERMLALACAISVDYNYFSRLSNNSGLLNAPLFMPMPLPGGGGAGEVPGAGVPPAGGDAGAAAGSAATGATGAGLDGAAADSSSAGTAWGDSTEGLGSGIGSSGGFGDDGESFKWDTGGGGEGGWGQMAGGGGEVGESSMLGDLFRWIWDLLSGGD